MRLGQTPFQTTKKRWILSPMTWRDGQLKEVHAEEYLVLRGVLPSQAMKQMTENLMILHSD